MTTMYNKLCHKQDVLFFLVGHIYIRDKDHQMSFKNKVKSHYTHPFGSHNGNFF